MKGKNLIRILALTLIISYTALYIMQATGYYEYSNHKTNVMTEQAAKKFEEDVKKGKDVKASDYITKDINYNNKISKGGIMLCSLIDTVFDKVMKFVFKEVGKAVSE